MLWYRDAHTKLKEHVEKSEHVTSTKFRIHLICMTNLER